MKDSDVQRIEHIKSYCTDIRNTIQRFGNSYETFEEDVDYQNSVSMSLLQIGELAGGLSDAFKDGTRPQMQWAAIRGMRNMFAHRYASMDLDVIWETATKDVISLEEFCDAIILENGQDFSQQM